MSVKISIDGDGLLYKTDTTIVKASQIITFLNSEMQASDRGVQSIELLPPSAAQNTQAYSNKSPRDVLLESDAKTNAQKILVFADYYCNVNSVELFDPKIIKGYFKKSGESEPRNFSRDWRDSIKQNFIYKSDKDKSYRITDYGYSLIKSEFSAITKNERIKRPSLNKTKKKNPKNISDNVKEIEIVGKEENMPLFHDVLTKGDRILWILNYALKKSIIDLSPNDIEYIADKLLDSISARGITALSEKNIKKGFMTKGFQGRFKILHDGIQYIETLNKNSNGEEYIQGDEGK